MKKYDRWIWFLIKGNNYNNDQVCASSSRAFLYNLLHAVYLKEADVNGHFCFSVCIIHTFNHLLFSKNGAKSGLEDLWQNNGTVYRDVHAQKTRKS